MTSESKAYEAQSMWDSKSDVEIRAMLVKVEGKHRSLCVEAAKRIEELAKCCRDITDRVFSGSNEASKAYTAPEEDKPLLPPWESA